MPTSKFNETTNELVRKTILINPLNITPIEETSTLIEEETQSIAQEETEIVSEPEVIAEEEVVERRPVQRRTPIVEENTESNRTAGGFAGLAPKISDKMGGSITRNELLDNKGITTEGDISIIHFELHLIDGLGGKVFTEESNQLNQEMKDALENVGQGETIYFENIRGKVKNGVEVRLNPLRYVLMN